MKKIKRKLVLLLIAVVGLTGCESRTYYVTNNQKFIVTGKGKVEGGIEYTVTYGIPNYNTNYIWIIRPADDWQLGDEITFTKKEK